MEEYNGEFIFDSEESSPSPLPNLFEGDAEDALRALDTAAAGDHKAYLSPSLTFATPAADASPQSVTGSHDSLSDSSSSKRTQSTASTKTTYTGGDVIMTDGPGFKENWEFSDFIHDPNDAVAEGGPQASGTALDDAANLGADVDDAFATTRHVVDIKSGTTSATSSPSPFTGGLDPSPPHLPNGSDLRTRKLSPPVAHTARGHSKGHSVGLGLDKAVSGAGMLTDKQQYSLDQAMDGLTTNGSREVSPFSNMAASHTSSPAAFRSSPSPSAAFHFAGLPSGLAAVDAQELPSQWPNSFALNPSSLQQGGMVPSFQIPGAMPTGPFGYQMPLQIPYMGPGTQNYILKVHPTPPKSRVETQIPIKLSLSPLPPGSNDFTFPLTPSASRSCSRSRRLNPPQICSSCTPFWSAPAPCKSQS